jgi:hypothetical protein
MGVRQLYDFSSRCDVVKCKVTIKINTFSQSDMQQTYLVTYSLLLQRQSNLQPKSTRTFATNFLFLKIRYKSVGHFACSGSILGARSLCLENSITLSVMSLQGCYTQNMFSELRDRSFGIYKCANTEVITASLRMETDIRKVQYQLCLPAADLSTRLHCIQLLSKCQKSDYMNQFYSVATIL